MPPLMSEPARPATADAHAAADRAGEGRPTDGPSADPGYPDYRLRRERHASSASAARNRAIKQADRAATNPALAAHAADATLANAAFAAAAAADAAEFAAGILRADVRATRDYLNGDLRLTNPVRQLCRALVAYPALAPFLWDQKAYEPRTADDLARALRSAGLTHERFAVGVLRVGLDYGAGYFDGTRVISGAVRQLARAVAAYPALAALLTADLPGEPYLEEPRA